MLAGVSNMPNQYKILKAESAGAAEQHGHSVHVAICSLSKSADIEALNAAPSRVSWCYHCD